MESTNVGQHHDAWNKGKLIGQKAPFKLKEIWSIRIRLQLERRLRELVFFNLGIDSKLRACDLLSLRVRDVCHGDRVAARAMVLQQKTQRPVQFEITADAGRGGARIKGAGLKPDSSSFRAACRRRLTFRLGSIPGSSGLGRDQSVLIQRPTALIQCGEPSRR